MSSPMLNSSSSPIDRSAASPAKHIGLIIAFLIGLMAISIIGSRLMGSGDVFAMPDGTRLFVLAFPAFLAGVLSFLSPCCLPVLSAYFAFTLQTKPERLLPTSLAFFGGLATTLVVLGATTTALSQLLFQNLDSLTLVGGVIIIAFGVMSLFGKGFSGIQLTNQPQTGTFGAYLYGATFALGWSACVGPILASLMTMLVTQGVVVLEGAVLTFVYALGLGTPIMLIVLFTRRIDKQSRFWRVLRGRGFSVQLGSRILDLHTTNIISGVLLITMGVLLATGQLAALSRWGLDTPLTQWAFDIEETMRQFLLGR